MALVEHALAAAIGDDRRGQPLGQRAHLVDRLVGAAADEDHRAFGLRQQAGGARDCILVERHVRVRRQRRQQLDLGFGGEHIGRQLDPNRPRAPGLQFAERLPDQAGRVLRPLDPLGPFGERAQDADLVGDLVQQAVALADGAARDLADEREHARAGRIGGGERRRRVEEARAPAPPNRPPGLPVASAAPSAM